MAKDNQEPIKFQLREEMWLDHNARSAEIASLSLEPEVEVQEESGLVMIKGFLILSGRYDALDEEDNALDVDADNFVEQLHFQPMKVDQRELYEREHRGKISKRFPVDITVPREKVADVDQVFVQVSHFDYNFDDRHRLQIEADVEITGIQSNREQDLIVEKRNGELRAERVADVYEPFAVSSTREEAQEFTRAEEVQIESETTYQEAAATQENNIEEETSMNQRQNHYEEEREEQEVGHEERVEAVDNRQAEDYTSERWNDNELDQEIELAQAEEAAQAKQDEDNVINLFDKREVQTKFHAAKSEDDEVSGEGEESKTTDFLAQLMAAKDEAAEESSTIRVTMCIAQRDETLEDIAGRYELKVTDIMRFNSLQTQEIQQGQILYIPRK